MDAVQEKDGVEFKQAIDSAMSEKIASALRDRKTEISNALFSEESPNFKREAQVDILNKKRKEAAADQNVNAMKGTAPVKG